MGKCPDGCVQVWVTSYIHELVEHAALQQLSMPDEVSWLYLL